MLKRILCAIVNSLYNVGVQGTPTVARPRLLRQKNAEVLLKLLRGNGPCSKADLVRASGLSAPTVTNVIAYLASAGLIEAVGEGDSTGGRPPDILRFRAERGCVLAAEISSRNLRLLLADLNGVEIGRAKIAVSRESSTPEEICARIGEEVRYLLARHGMGRDQLLQVVIGAPAIVDVARGKVVSLSPLKEWRDVPLGNLLKRELKCPVTVENDTNLAACGEHFRGAAQGEENFVFISISEGVGAGIFLGGRIYRGAEWSAGEIGYLRVPSISRADSTLQGYGRLEKVLGASGILKSWQHLSRGTRTNLRVTSAAHVLDLAAAGNARAKRILLQRAQILSDAILDLALILNPAVILLGGEVGNHPRLLQEVKRLLAGSEVPRIRVGVGKLGASAVLWGGICVSVESALAALLDPAE